MSTEDFRETGADLYHDGGQARIRDAAFDPSKPRPWQLGWQDSDEQIATMTRPAGYFGHRKDGSAKVFRRSRTGSATGAPLNPQYEVRRHSPTGLEWGYMGSGPAQLSLAILIDYLGNVEQAQDLYQDFKNAVVVELPYDEWTLSNDEVKDALDTIREEHALRAENSRST